MNPRNELFSFDDLELEMLSVEMVDQDMYGAAGTWGSISTWGSAGTAGSCASSASTVGSASSFALH